MTDNNDRSPMIVIAGEPLHEILKRNRATLVGLVLEELQVQIAAYRMLPSEELLGDITTVTEHNLRMFIRMVETAEPAREEDLVFLRESAARRAEEGIGVDSVLTAYQVAAQVGWDFVLRHARPEDVDALSALMRLVLRWLQAVTAAVAGGYLEEARWISDEEEVTRHALLAALIDGKEVDSATGRAGVPLPGEYLVLSLGVLPHPDERAPGTDATIAARRKLRRLRFELHRQIGDVVLSELTSRGGTALIPLTDSYDADRTRKLVEDLNRAAGAAVTAGAATAPPQQVKHAAELARDVLEVAMAIGRPPGLYTLDDVLLDYQLSRPSAARDRLAARFDPLDEHPDLEDTLRVFLRHGRARRPTASALHVHPNTVDYRLRKIGSLTGLDPTDATHTATIEAALVARATGRR